MRRLFIISGFLLGFGFCARAQYADSTIVDTSFLHQVTIVPSGYGALNAGTGKQSSGFNGSGYQTGLCTSQGPYFSISLSKPIVSHLGFALLVGYGINKTDAQSYCESYEQHIASESIIDPGNGYFSELAFMAGPFLTLPIHRLSLDCRLLFGTMDWNSPSISYMAVDNFGNETPEQVQGKSLESYVFGIGAGARLRIYREWTLIANADYTHSFNSSTNPALGFETLTAGIAYQY
jgi:hypothetical protein